MSVILYLTRYIVVLFLFDMTPYFMSYTRKMTARVHIGIMKNRKHLFMTTNTQAQLEEYLMGNLQDDSYNDVINAFRGCRKQLNIIRDASFVDDNKLWWVAVRNNMVIDMTLLEKYFISGKIMLSSKEIASKWSKTCDDRIEFVTGTSKSSIFIDIGDYTRELNSALSAVHRASYLSLYMQSNFLRNGQIISKSDLSPVTLADLSVQALIIDHLHRDLPSDKFIAEEDTSAFSTGNTNDINIILNSLNCFDNTWTTNRLIEAVDKGNAFTSEGRVWVLDPIDGTKGYIRGEHFCIALALMENGKPILSVLGCPNLDLNRVQTGVNIDKIHSMHNITYQNKIFHVPHVHTGSLYFAVTNNGAYARSLSMPLGSAIELQVSQINSPSDATLCESAEQSYGSRELTSKIRKLLQVRKDYLRLDGQCKLCLVGAGAAESNLRLPPAGYVEKIWDHAAGYHFITEAGGKVTDLEGNDLDFTKGRYFSPSVTGVVSSNGVLHDKILDAIRKVKLTQN